MKPSFLIVVSLLVIILSGKAPCHAQPDPVVEEIDVYPNLFRYQNFYLGGQPSLDALKWLRSEGVTRIINIRSGEENENYASEAYNEAAMANSMGYDYYSIPVKGSENYTPEKLEEISLLMNEDEKILIHCRSAGRVSNFFMAYLVRTRSYSVNEAIEVGKGLKFYFPLEDILGTKINMEIEDGQ